MTKHATQRQGFDARKLRIILVALMALIILASGAAFTFGVNFIKEYALEISSKRSAAEASDSSLQSLQETETFLNNNQAVLDKADRLRADAKSNEKYPEIAIIESVRKLAQANNLGIESIAASGSGNGASGSSNTTAQQPTTTTPPTSGTTAAPLTTSDTVSVSVSLSTPTNYRNFLQFLADVEQSVPLMKVDGVDLSPANSSNNQITASAITIHMYIKKGA